MRNFNFQDEANTSAANLAGVSPALEEQPPQILRDEDAPRFEREETREDAMNAFRKSADDEDDRTGKTAKIAGAALVGLLLVGGGIYAYQSSSANHAPQKVAMIPPAPKPAADQTASQQPAQPEATPAPSDSNAAPATPVSSAPKVIHRAGLASAKPSSSSQQDAVNQPMTLTPQTAPAPEQAASNNQQPAAVAPAPQTAMQQPIVAPSIAAPTVQPSPELANNAPSSVKVPQTAPAADAAQAQTAPASTSQDTAQMDNSAPAPAQ